MIALGLVKFGFAHVLYQTKGTKFGIMASVRSRTQYMRKSRMFCDGACAREPAYQYIDRFERHGKVVIRARDRR